MFKHFYRFLLLYLSLTNAIEFDRNPFQFLVRFSFPFHGSSLKVRHFLSKFKQTILRDGNGKRLFPQGHLTIEDVFLRKMYVSSLHDFKPQMKIFFRNYPRVFCLMWLCGKNSKNYHQMVFKPFRVNMKIWRWENVTVIFFLAAFEAFFYNKWNPRLRRLWFCTLTGPPVNKKSF